MRWIEGIGEAINYIEENITEEIPIENIAKKSICVDLLFPKRLCNAL